MSGHIPQNCFIFIFSFILWFQLPAQDFYVHYEEHHDEKHHKPDEPTKGHEEPGIDDWNDDGTESLTRLKAIVISADVDGVNGAFTMQYKARMQKAADFLRGKGLQVHEFFCPNDNWQQIVEQSKGAHILIYSGHGVYDGSTPPVWVGGFSLTKSFVSSKQIQDDLKLAPNAVVIFNQACFTAGSAGNDTGDIGLAEAHRRVSIYAHPFVDLNVGCYYANNFYDSAIAFLQKIFAGKNAGEIYHEEASSWSTILEEKPYDFNDQYTMGISRYGTDQYSVAYVAKRDFNMHRWFGK